MSQTIREIYAQYDSLKETIELLQKRKEELQAFFREAKPRAILFTGCGSSFSLCRSLQTILSMRSRTPSYAVASGDLMLNCARYRGMLEDTLVVAISRSGRTSESIKAFEAVRALGVGARYLSLICATDTPLGAMSDFVLEIPWAFDESVCQTRSVTNLYALGAMVIGAIFGDDAIERGMRRMAEVGPGYLERTDPIAREIAKADWNHAVVLADAEIDGLAEEGALAYKEISQINSNYYHLLDVRHGPMVLIGPGTMVLASVSAPGNRFEMGLVDDLIARGAKVVCYSQGAVRKDGATCISLGEDVGPVAGGLGLIALCQLISYHKSGVMGCNPDQPDGLDAWIRID